MLKSGIEYIYAVYQTQSFSRAAERLYISQPALSTAIQREEAYWGCTFFDRSKSPIELTPEGKYLINAIERMKEIQTDVESYFERLNAGKLNSLNIGAPAFFCTYILPSIVKSFKNIYPDCKVNVVEGSDKDLWNGLQTGAIDCCISVENGASNMITMPLIKESIVLAVPKSYKVNHKLVQYQLDQTAMETRWYIKDSCIGTPIQEFNNYPFLLLNKGNDMRKRAYSIFREGKIEPQVFMTLEQMTTSFYMVVGGMGISFVRAGFIQYKNEDVCFYKVNSKFTVRNVNLIIKKNKPASPQLNIFIQHLKENILGTP